MATRTELHLVESDLEGLEEAHQRAQELRGYVRYLQEQPLPCDPALMLCQYRMTLGTIGQYAELLARDLSAL